MPVGGGGGSEGGGDPYQHACTTVTGDKKKARPWKWRQMTAAKISAAQIAPHWTQVPKLTDAVMRFQMKEHWCIVTGHKEDRVQSHYRGIKSSLWLMKQSPLETAYKELLERLSEERVQHLVLTPEVTNVEISCNAL